MRRHLIVLSIAVVFASTLFAHAEPAKSAHAKDEAEIRASIESYLQAYNKGDAQAVASLWSEEGEWVSPAGARIQGRKAIATELEQVFKASPGLSIELTNPSIRFITNDVAMEEGSVKVMRSGEVTSEATYIAVHVRRDGKWQLDSVRETEIPDLIPAQANLKELAWLVGEWVDLAEDSLVETKVTWTKDKRFLTCNFRVSLPEIEPLEGVQIIGWDPAAGVIRSWVFDSAGTIGEGVWSHDGNQWIVKSTQVLADGSRAVATNVYTIQDENSYSWKSFGRYVEGRLQKDIDKVLVVRKSAVNHKPDAPTKPKSESNNPASKKSKTE
jgi:uncharacterized protein (TIGR02246 family)